MPVPNLAPSSLEMDFGSTIDHPEITPSGSICCCTRKGFDCQWGCGRCPDGYIITDATLCRNIHPIPCE